MPSAARSPCCRPAHGRLSLGRALIQSIPSPPPPVATATDRLPLSAPTGISPAPLGAPRQPSGLPVASARSPLAARRRTAAAVTTEPGVLHLETACSSPPLPATSRRQLALPRSSSAMGSTPVELPMDILMEIIAGLEVPDLARACSVCSSWHRAYTSLLDLGRWKQPQTPCLLYTAKSRGASVAGLYSLAEKKPYTLAILDPPIRGRMFVGSAHGWLVTADEHSELHLVNPVTGDQIALPPVATIKCVSPIYGEDGTVQAYHHSWRSLVAECEWPPKVFALHKLRYKLFHKAFLSSDPSTGSYIVAIIYNTYRRLSFARVGDDRWTSLPQHDFFEDCVFKDELLYALTNLGTVHVFDLSGPEVKQKKVVLEDVKDYLCEKSMFIVQAPCGDLLQIWNSPEEDLSQPELDQPEEDGDLSEPEFDIGPYPHNYPTFKVYRVDLAEKKLVEISSLGENVLFLGFNQSLCLRAEEHPQLKANHVYFTDDDQYMASYGRNERRSIGVLNLSDNSIEMIVSPHIWSNWPSPVWITPNPRKMMSRLGSNVQGRTDRGPLALPLIARWRMTVEGQADGKTMSLNKVAVKIPSYLFYLIAIFIFGLLGKIRSIGCLIFKKLSSKDQ